MELSSLSLEVWGIALLYGLIPTALAYLLYYYGVARIRENSKVPVLASIETVIALLFGIVQSPPRSFQRLTNQRI